MTDLVVIVPSRGRPQAARELAEAFEDTCTLPDTQLVFALDKSDMDSFNAYPQGSRATTWWTESSTMVEALNMRATELLAGQMVLDIGYANPFAIGFMGDDHRPRTRGWDARYLEVLRELGTGIVYGDDLLQRDKLPTQCAMTADIVRALGWMAPPVLTHLYVDNFWRELGTQAACLRYVPDVVVEHLHPVAGKAEWDEGHTRVNDRSMYERDGQAYQRFVTSGQAADALRKVLALRQVPA